MPNAQNTSRNLIFNCKDLGRVAVQPSTFEEEAMKNVGYVVFPQRIPAPEFEAAMEWASSSDALVFIIPSDLKRFEAEGFGSYRFHLLSGFRELGFLGGKIKFIPAMNQQKTGIWGLAMDLADAWKWTRREGFHVLIKPHQEPSILYLASPFLDRSEWALLAEDNPSVMVGSRFVRQNDWTILERKLGKNIAIPGDSKKPESNVAAALLAKRLEEKVFEDSEPSNRAKDKEWTQGKKSSFRS